MSLRRFGPLMGAVVVLLALTLSRLYDIQVREHGIWAREAVNLVRSATIEPYRRGSLLDRDGRVLVRDQSAYELEFVWRDFRRGHPLGQVATMRSLLLMRPVSLEDTRASLHEWAEDFVRLSPRAIDEFGRGESITVGDKFVPRAAGASGRERKKRARAERRRARSADLHYYVKALLDLDTDRRLARAVEKLRGTARDRPYIELVALAGGGGQRVEASVMGLRADLHRRIEESLDHLGRLAALVDWDTLPDAEGASSLDRLVDVLEDTRRYVEDTSADELFRRAAGFGPSRLDGENLGRLDLDWLRRCLYWDQPRMDEWIRERGLLWPAVVREYLAGHAIARFKLDEGAPPAARVLAGLAHFFRARDERTGAPRDWRRMDDLVVVSGLRGRFEDTGEVPDELLGPVLPIQAEELAGRELSGSELLIPVLRASLGGGEHSVAWSQEALEEAARGLLALANPERLTWDPPDEELVEELLLGWDRLLQDRVASIFARMPDSVRLAPDFVDAAIEDRPYVVRDRGARSQRLAADPRYELVHLVTRYPRRYAGFRARSATRRVPVEFYDDEGEVPVAAPLMGRVRAPYLVNLLKQREHEVALFELQSKLQLLARDRERILEVIQNTYHPGEFMGGSGIEGYFDEELSGVNGYRESQGLQDQKEGNRQPIHEPPRDGLDVALTLDLDLQRAAQSVLEHPAPPPAGETRPDRVWWENPVGAIVLVAPDGDVLVAASAPMEPHETFGRGQDGQRRFAYERTLRQYTFQPPGSVFKPFVAAWGLEFERAGTEALRVDCEPEEGTSWAGYGHMRCWSQWGHGRGVDLHHALVGSCNSWFAALGEQVFDGEELARMAHAFGFDRPTGVRALGQDREGLLENWRSRGFLSGSGPLDGDVLRQRFANGLAHVSATPSQVARAYAGLATGWLPELRIADRVGADELPRRGQRLPVGEPALERVRSALREVVTDGTAKGKGLDVDTLGFTFAAKTGSADYVSEASGLVPVDPAAPLSRYVFKKGVRKHTWVAGWFPAEAPEAILVVYLHDTSTTSSHSAVYVAAQFLRASEVREFLEGRLATRSAR